MVSWGKQKGVIRVFRAKKAVVQGLLIAAGIAWCASARCAARPAPCSTRRSGCAWSVSALDKKKQSVSLLLSRFRGWIQAAATLLTNIHLPNFFKGGIYQGKGKSVCVPGLNCYSCPAASGACPIGAFQAVVGSSKFRFSYYITGILILLGVLLGRFICGFLCPFGWLQELLHKIPGKKLSTKKLKPLTYLKYVILLLAVVLLPALIVNDVGMGDPYFCKYICPQGVLEARSRSQPQTRASARRWACCLRAS